MQPTQTTMSSFLTNLEDYRYQSSLVDDNDLDLDGIFDQFIEPSAFENCSQLDWDSAHSFLNNEEYNGSGMDVDNCAVITPTFDQPICPEASLLSYSDVASTCGVANRFDNDWFDSLWIPPSVTGWQTQNPMQEMVEETQTLVVPSAPSQSLTPALEPCTFGRTSPTPATPSSQGSTRQLRHRRPAFSPVNKQTSNENDTTVPSFRCPWSECTSRFNSPEEAFVHAKFHHHLYHPDSKTLICPHRDCTYTSVRINDVRRHCQTASHGMPPAFFCRGCERRFTRKDATKRHQLQSAKDPLCIAYAGSDRGVGIVGECDGWRRQ
ncbi:uncharacterized protein EV420DRAFT_1519668 [Desarmillaria tabescens]|uniref:C2H2-type domain-containing protein n=1 Tax=Armillaria tabescens TaxID=1929756 RepID=A0AA39NDY9_ARMTA|nr:uncharacterized protein EV420DRAFT_1519668 [Desarmillaria tabescens]KAK0463718.1 hypothetical protein EV420DRAFT_1519668 [Desarmillaria tabescens]